jgi:hypothetical protein
VNIFALPVFAVDPMAAVPATPDSPGFIETDEAHAASNAFLEMLLASEATFQGAVPVEARPQPKSEAPVIPTSKALIRTPQEPVCSSPQEPATQEAIPVLEESRDSVATAYAMVATMRVVTTPSAPLKVAPIPVTAAEPLTPAPVEIVSSSSTAIAIEEPADASPEASEEPGHVDEISFDPWPAESSDFSGIPVPAPVPSATSVPPVRPDFVTDGVDVSPVAREWRAPSPSPLPNQSNSVPARAVDETHAPAGSPPEAPVILAALITNKAATTGNAEVAPRREQRSILVQLPSHDTTNPEPMPAIQAEPRPEMFEGTPQRDAETKEEHAEAPPQEKTPLIDRTSPVPALAATNPAIKPERPASLESSRHPIPIAEDRQVPGAERTPLKQIDVRIPDPNGDVTVRLQERAGSLHVSVRSSDSQIATRVANGLPDLTRTLDREGFHAETWTPRGSPVTDIRAHDPLGPVTIARVETQPITHADQSQTEDGRGENQREPDRQEQQDKRRKRQSEEDFKENLW